MLESTPMSALLRAGYMSKTKAWKTLNRFVSDCQVMQISLLIQKLMKLYWFIQAVDLFYCFQLYQEYCELCLQMLTSIQIADAVGCALWTIFPNKNFLFNLLSVLFKLSRSYLKEMIMLSFIKKKIYS